LEQIRVDGVRDFGYDHRIANSPNHFRGVCRINEDLQQLFA
jgi:hypothetical protein